MDSSSETHIRPASDTYDKLIDLPADLENLVRQRSLVNSDDFDNDAPHQSYQDQDWWTLEEPPQVDDSLIGIELVDNGDFENGTESWTPQWNGTLTANTMALARVNLWMENCSRA